MIYVALLRGINVGGKNSINMKDLKQSFEEAGIQNVVTYINSGNIIFSDTKHDRSDLVDILEDLIKSRFTLEIKVLLLSLDDFNRLMDKLPSNWTNDNQMKSDVLFLWDEVDQEDILSKIKIAEGIDTVFYVKGALLWSTPRDMVTKSGLVKLAGNKLYKQMTIRNVNSTRKIYQLMTSLSEI
jgi:uncharacterized protein (DUF1697 family)